VIYDGVESDPGEMFDTSTGIFRCREPGRYLVTASVTWNVNPWQQNALAVYRNNAIAKRIYHMHDAWSGQMAGSSIVRCELGDELDIRMYGSIAWNATANNWAHTHPGAEFTWAQFTYLGPL
jgi:hypothetical protein